MATKSVYFVGNEEGHVYAPTPNMIYVRERILITGEEISHTVEIPERYHHVTFRHGELVFVVFEGGKGYVNGKDFRKHISELSDTLPAPKPKPDFSRSFGVSSYTFIDRGEIESKGTTADDKGKTLLERWEKDNDQLS